MPQPSPEVLYTSGQVNERLTTLFAEPEPNDRRVALVAYVGGGALNYLASPKDLYVICNPSAGGTSPRALRKLIGLGAHVQLSRNLHAKVYWSEKRGCIMGSANASNNALGIGGLKEAAVFLPPGMVDIDRLIAEAAPQNLTEKALRRLQRDTNALPQRPRGHANPELGQNDKPMDFRGWFEQWGRNTDCWKLGFWFASDTEPAKSGIARAQKLYAVDEVASYICVTPDTAERGDWLLTFQAPEGKVMDLDWLFVDFVEPVFPDDKHAFHSDFPCQAIQARTPKNCPIPPFKITPQFKKAFSHAVRESNIEELGSRAYTTLEPPDELLKRTYDLMPEKS